MGGVKAVVSVMDASCCRHSVKSQGGFPDSGGTGRVFLGSVEMVNGSHDFVGAGRDSPYCAVSCFPEYSKAGCDCLRCLKTGRGSVGSTWKELYRVSEGLGGHLAYSEAAVLLVSSRCVAS